MTTGTVQKQAEKKAFDWKWMLSWLTPIVIALIAFVYALSQRTMQSNTEDAVNSKMLIHCVDSIKKAGVEKDKRDNEQDLVIKDFKETMIEYAQRQERMYLQVQDEQRLTRKILEKMDRKVGAANDLIEELKEKQEQNNQN